MVSQSFHEAYIWICDVILCAPRTSRFGHVLLKLSFYPSSHLAEHGVDRRRALAVAGLQRVWTGSRMVVFTDSALDEERAVAHNSEPCSCFQPRLPQLCHNKNSPFLVDSPQTTKPHVSSSPSTSLPFKQPHIGMPISNFRDVLQKQEHGRSCI